MRIFSSFILLAIVSCQENPASPNQTNMDFMPNENPIRFSKTVISGPFTSEERILTYTILSKDTLDGATTLRVELKDSLVESLVGTNPTKIRKGVGNVKITPDTVIVDSVLNMIVSGPAGVISPWLPIRNDIINNLPTFCSMSTAQDSVKCSYFSSVGSTSYNQRGYWKRSVGLTFSEKGYFSPGGSNQERYYRL